MQGDWKSHMRGDVDTIHTYKIIKTHISKGERDRKSYSWKSSVVLSMDGVESWETFAFLIFQITNRVLTKTTDAVQMFLDLTFVW